jgi:hypothetical protein
LCPGLATSTGKLAPAQCARQMYSAYVVAHLGQSWKPATLSDAMKSHRSML